MSSELLVTLSQDYGYLLDAGEKLADVEIRVGKEQKIFKAHSLVLWTRSPYFRSEVWNDEEDREDTLDNTISFALPDINSKTFTSLLKYIYVGELESSSHKNLKDAVYLMLGADDLGLTNLVNFLQNHIASRKNQLKNIFFFVNRTVKEERLPQLRELCDTLLVENPLSIINSQEFLTVDKDELLYFYENLPDDSESPTTFPEITLWNKLIDWCTKSLKLTKDINSFNSDELEALKQLAEPFLEFITFNKISRNEFLTKVKPYKSILNQELYIELLESHTNDDQQPQQTQQTQQTQRQPQQPPQPQQPQPPPTTRRPQNNTKQRGGNRQKRTMRTRQPTQNTMNPPNPIQPTQNTMNPSNPIQQTHRQQTYQQMPTTNPLPFRHPLGFHPQNFQHPFLQYQSMQYQNPRLSQDDDDSLSSSSSESQQDDRSGWNASHIMPNPLSVQPTAPFTQSTPIPNPNDNSPSVIIKKEHFRLLRRWINRVHGRPQESPYDFNLLVRGTASGFSAKSFHRRCNRRGPTITLLKVQRTNEIIGGYNPLYWDSPQNNGMQFLETNESFIFSLNFESPKDSIISRVSAAHTEKAIFLSGDSGPSFGSSLNIEGDLKVSGNNFANCVCRNLMYERPIRSSRSKFGLDDYEVFQVAKVEDE